MALKEASIKEREKSYKVRQRVVEALRLEEPTERMI